MSEPSPPRPHPRARPLAELSLDQLIARSEELAQSWAVALVLSRPPQLIGEVPLERIGREGPFLCAQLARALQSNVELDRLTGEGPPSGREQSAAARRLASIVGAEDGAETADAVEALRGVLWVALLEEIRRPGVEPLRASQLADLSDRLAQVCAGALSACLRFGDQSDPPLDDEVTVSLSAPTTASRHPQGQSQSHLSAVIVDERRTDQPPPERSAPRPVGIEGELESTLESTTARPSHRSGRPLSWDESPPVPPARRNEEIEIRDERGEEGPAAWIGAIGRQLERYRQDGLPFAVLLLEPVEIDRLRRSEPPEELRRLVTELEEALTLHWSGTMTRQRPARYWLLAPATNHLSARDLGERLQESLSTALIHGGSPLQVAIGIATCPQDGLEASALAAHADVGLYAARSALRRASGSDTPRIPAPIIDEPA